MSNATNTAGTPAGTLGPTPAPVLTPRREVWLSLKGNRGAMAALTLIVLLVLIAICAPLLAPHDFAAQNVDPVDLSLQPPAWDEGGSWTYVLGTDGLGLGPDPGLRLGRDPHGHLGPVPGQGDQRRGT